MSTTPYETRKRIKPTTIDGDLKRKKLLAFVNDGHWFSITEASKATRMNRHQGRKFVYELRDKGFLKERRRKQETVPSQPPMEYSYQDNWHVLTETTNPVVKNFYRHLKELADIYRAGLIPAMSNPDDVLTDIGNEIERLEETVKLLKMMYENPDLRKINSFVKRMS